MKKIMTAGIILSVLGIFLALVPWYILPVCDTMVELSNGKTAPMGCHYMGVVVTMGGQIGRASCRERVYVLV